MQLKLDPKELALYKNNDEIIRETANQLIKDFSLYDENITFSGNSYSAYDELFKQVNPIVDRKINLDPTNFFAMLYTIDIDEKEVKKALFSDSIQDPSGHITDMILQRELMKVIIRKHFSNSI